MNNMKAMTIIKSTLVGILIAGTLALNLNMIPDYFDLTEPKQIVETTTVVDEGNINNNLDVDTSVEPRDVEVPQISEEELDNVMSGFAELEGQQTDAIVYTWSKRTMTYNLTIVGQKPDNFYQIPENVRAMQEAARERVEWSKYLMSKGIYGVSIIAQDGETGQVIYEIEDGNIISCIGSI